MSSPTHQALSTLRFVYHAVVAGLAMAFVAVLIEPALIAPGAASATSAPVAGPPSYAGAVRLAAPAVVNIHTIRVVRTPRGPLHDDIFLRRLFEHGDPEAGRLETDLGSGVLLGPPGVVLTNHHVIAGADAIQVMLRDGRMAPAELVGADLDTDLAVLRIELDDLPSIASANVEDLSVGDVVLAIGNPFGIGQTVTMGIVSAKGRSRLGINTFEDFIQTDAAINPGNSGGALITAHGRLVGINTAIVSQGGGSEGLGFAIPVDVALHVTTELLAHGYVRRGWLGIEVHALTPSGATRLGLENGTTGVIISDVLAAGPGARAGLEAGDLLTQVDGRPVLDPQMAVNAISSIEPGALVQLTVRRAGALHDLLATVSQRPS